ncbi:hypothetical protein K458DRAFT_421968 [Lentithecium fluviatile CBS 122367]|uniref:Uncharacterized protein n=1 Tax=Lentithecium fluviatile CBS 122367 TaxID=1168545 RepID=A0A6G1IPU5_9PLEO|nr:hypothetical protein K458DRAFT_421968 [Lentithecium fluviatile CBS 122367]
MAASASASRRRRCERRRRGSPWRRATSIDLPLCRASSRFRLAAAATGSVAAVHAFMHEGRHALAASPASTTCLVVPVREAT